MILKYFHYLYLINFNSIGFPSIVMNSEQKSIALFIQQPKRQP